MVDHLKNSDESPFEVLNSKIYTGCIQKCIITHNVQAIMQTDNGTEFKK